MKIPDKIFGREIGGAMDRYLDSKKTVKQEKPTTNITNSDSCLILQSRRGDYPDLIVDINRLDHNMEVETALKKLAIYDNLIKRAGQNTNGTQNPVNPKGYLGYIQHQEALNINEALGNFTLPLLYFADLLYNLTEGIKGNKLIYNANGNQIDTKLLENMFNEITEVRSPWRAEQLDGKFGENTITYHKFVDGTFKEATEPLEDCLMEDKTPGIDLEDWLKNPTSQGLPRKKCKAGKLYYWHPRNGTVAGFGADSDRAVLYCDRNPQSSNADLGVRSARRRHAKKLEYFKKIF